MRIPLDAQKLLGKLSVTQAARISNLSKSYISQVKHGRRAPSQKLLNSLQTFENEHFPTLEKEHTQKRINYLTLFMRSRQAMDVTPLTIRYYKGKLGRFFKDVDADEPTSADIEAFLIQFRNPGNRHTYYRVVKTFYHWREDIFDIPSPMKKIKAPKMPKLILPSLSIEQVTLLLNTVDDVRDKAIIALFTDSGLRLSELVNIKLEDIDWESRTIQVIGKGRKEALAPFGKRSEQYLREWLSQYDPKGGNIWGLTRWGIVSMLNRLEVKIGIKCNPHVFRRTFATLLRKAGLDVMTIQTLGRWESLEMVQRYTRSFNFHDCLKFYREPVT